MNARGPRSSQTHPKPTGGGSDEPRPTLRLQKHLAEAGIASRRAAESLIRDGRVSVNGQIVTTLGSRVDPALDTVTVDGRAVRARRRLYLALNKPVDFVCTRSDEQGRRTVLDLLPAEWSTLVYPVGRLDRESEGLLLLTNDGDFCLRVTHPRYGVSKIYHACVPGKVAPTLVPELVRGVEVDGERLKALRARILSANHTRSVLELELTEGRNREVRRLLGALGLTVERLQRVRIGPVRLAELPVGKWRTLSGAEIRGLSQQDANRRETAKPRGTHKRPSA